MKNEDWFSRYAFCAPVGRCGNNTFFLAKDCAQHIHVIIKQYSNTPKENQEDQKLTFQDEARLLQILQEKGLVRFFDCQTIDGTFFLVTDVPAACELLCSHIEPAAIERAIKQYAF